MRKGIKDGDHVQGLVEDIGHGGRILGDTLSIKQAFSGQTVSQRIVSNGFVTLPVSSISRTPSILFWRIKRNNTTSTRPKMASSPLVIWSYFLELTHAVRCDED
jgi:hypothetical protein